MHHYESPIKMKQKEQKSSPKERPTSYMEMAGGEPENETLLSNGDVKVNKITSL